MIFHLCYKTTDVTGKCVICGSQQIIMSNTLNEIKMILPEAKIQAEQLVDAIMLKMCLPQSNTPEYIKWTTSIKCALVAVDEIVTFFKRYEITSDDKTTADIYPLTYWIEVERELEVMKLST